MRRKRRLAALLLFSGIGCPAASALAQSSVQEERIAASFVLALGRTPAPVEVAQWEKEGPLPLAELVGRHRRHLQADAVAGSSVTVKAGEDAFGSWPIDVPGDTAPGGATYVDLVRLHLRWLAEHPADYEQVLHRAYRKVLQRDAYSVEIEYWKRQPVLSFALLCACVEDWARRNQPGLMATTGVAALSVNSAYLNAVRLSPSVAMEARAVAGLPPARNRALAAAAGRVVVAAGVEHLVSVGGIHFVAAGAAGLASPDRER